MTSRVDVLSWERTDADKESHRHIIDSLNAMDNVEVDESAFIADGAHVYPTEFTLGADSYISAGAIIRGNIHMGHDCTVNPYTQISGNVKIGNYVRIASNGTIVGFNHGFDDVNKPICRQPCYSKGIIIEDDVWIGANVVICDGVTVGAHSILAAGSIVVKDVAPYSIVGGNPAKLIRDRRETKSKKHSAKDSVVKSLTHISDSIHQQWCSILERCESPAVNPHYNTKSYINMPGAEHAVRPNCDAIEIAAAINFEAPLLNKDQYLEQMHNLQGGTYGFILDPKNSQPENNQEALALPDAYHFLCVGYALECLGSQTKEFSALCSNISVDELYTHFENLEWDKRGWGCGSWFDCYCTAMYHNYKHHGDHEKAAAMKPEAIFGWLDMHNNPATGMWSKPDHESGWLQAVNGFYRLTRGTYAQFGRPLPHPEAAINTILSHCHNNGNFMDKNITACNVLDIVHPLWLCAKQSDYRSAEITTIMEQQINAISKRWIKDQGFAFSPDQEAGLMGTEMWLSITAIAADYLGLGEHYRYTPKGVHRMEVAYQL